MANPDIPFITLQNLLSKKGELSEMRKLLAYTVFEALTPEEQAQITAESALTDVIAHVVSTPEPDGDGSIPDGGRQARPFLHLYRSQQTDGADYVEAERPRSRLLSGRVSVHKSYREAARCRRVCDTIYGVYVESFGEQSVP